MCPHGAAEGQEGPRGDSSTWTSNKGLPKPAVCHLWAAQSPPQTHWTEARALHLLPSHFGGGGILQL